MNAPFRRGACPALSAPMATGDGLLVRLGIAGVALAPSMLGALCAASVRYGNGIVEVTARGNLQIRGLTQASALRLSDTIAALDLPVSEGPAVDTSPLAGLDPTASAAPRPLAKAIREGLAAKGLGRRLAPKFSVVIDDAGQIDLDALSADIRLTATGIDGALHWLLALGGDATSARPFGCVREDKAATAVLALATAIAALGPAARGCDLSADAVSAALDGVALTDARSGNVPRRSEIGAFDLRDDKQAIGIAPPFGQADASALSSLCEAALAAGVAEIRLAPGRALLLIGPRVACATARDAAERFGLVTDAADARLAITACPGAPGCASGRIAARALAAEIAAGHAGLLDTSAPLHVSGCAKGCAHPRAAPLTLVGEGEDCALVLDGRADGRPIARVPASDAGAAAGRLASLLSSERQAGETVEACLARLGETSVAEAFGQERP